MIGSFIKNFLTFSAGLQKGNDAAPPVTITYLYRIGRELLKYKVVGKNSDIVLDGWGVGIVERGMRAFILNE